MIDYSLLNTLIVEGMFTAFYRTGDEYTGCIVQGVSTVTFLVYNITFLCLVNLRMPNNCSIATNFQ